MKKLVLVLLTLLLSVGLFATDILAREPLRPFYGYLMMGTGYTGTFSNYDYAQAFPLSIQAGTLHNSNNGKMALGFGVRLDMEMGSDGYEFLLSMDSLYGLDMFFRLNRNVGIDVLLGFAVGMKDVGREVRGELLFTMGPGAVASVRLSPSSFTGLAFDFGLAVYGNFGLANSVSYSGVTFIPFVGMTFDLSTLSRNRYYENMVIF